MAPVVRPSGDGERELVLMSWGFVLQQAGKAPRRVTNTRDDKVQDSRFWRDSFEARTGSGHTVVMDNGEGDTGARPAELVGVALGGCTGMDVISILRKKRQEVTHFEVEVNGARATDYPKVYTDIEVVYRVRGHNIDQASFERAIQLSEERYCPAMSMLRKAANITNRYEIEQEY